MENAQLAIRETRLCLSDGTRGANLGPVFKGKGTNFLLIEIFPEGEEGRPGTQLSAPMNGCSVLAVPTSMPVTSCPHEHPTLVFENIPSGRLGESGNTVGGAGRQEPSKEGCDQRCVLTPVTPHHYCDGWKSGQRGREAGNS